MKNKEELEKNTGVKCISSIDGIKKFDICLMNPPYDKNLHLKFLEKVINICNKVVSIQPTPWIQDPVAFTKRSSTYNKYKESIINHVEEIEIIPTLDAVKLFGAGFNADVGIYKCSKSHTDGCELPIKINKSILNKVLNNGHFLSDVLEHDKRDGWRIQITELQPNMAQGGKLYSYGWYCQFCIYNHLRSTIYKDGYKDCKDWTKFNSGIKKEEGKGFPDSIKFNTEQEAINFENSLKTLFYEYLVYTIKMNQHTPFKHLPWMIDYKEPWTDERFRKYFKITDDEWDSVVETMKPITDALKNKKMIEELEKKTGIKKFDICLMNPPYLGDSRNDYNFPLKFLNKVCEITDKIVSIQPIMYLYKTYERKHPEQVEKTAINNAETYKYEVDEITGKEFDAAFGNKIGIIYCDTTKNSDIIIVNGKQYNTVSEINNFSSDSLLVEFNNIVRPLSKHDSVIKHWNVIDKRNEKTGKDLRRINDSKLKTTFVKVAAIRGNKGTDSMYSILPRTRTFEHGERPYTYINFETETEANGFINYVKTDFCCIILYMYKNDMMLGPHLHYIPWFDFSQDIFSKSPREIDDYLFKKYNISDDIRKHIEEILPDYYNIRK